jgi:flavin reductase ActVB
MASTDHVHPAAAKIADAEFLSGAVAPGLFREAMTRFASGVTIVTTVDVAGRWYGFTASAFTSLSLEPPLVLVCIATSADSHAAFVAAPQFMVNVLASDHEQLALRFATKGISKFDDGNFRPGAASGLPVLDDALVSLNCQSRASHEGGDHTILIGEVKYVRVHTSKRPALHYGKRFWDIVEPTK